MHSAPSPSEVTNIFLAHGLIFWPCLVAASLAFYKRRGRSKNLLGSPSWSSLWRLVLHFWGLLSILAFYVFFESFDQIWGNEFSWNALFEMRQDGFLLVFESLAALTFIFLGAAHPRHGVLNQNLFRRGSMPVFRAALVSVDVIALPGLVLYLLSAPFGASVETLETTSDGLWIGTNSRSTKEAALFHYAVGSAGAPQPLENSQRWVGGFLETEKYLWVGSANHLERVPLGDRNAVTKRFDVRFADILAYHRGDLWAGGSLNPLLRLSEERGEAIRIRSSPPNQRLLRNIKALLSQGEVLWIGTRNGLYRWQPGFGETVEPVAQEVRSASVLVESSGDLFVGGFRGLYRLHSMSTGDIERIPLVAKDDNGAQQEVNVDIHTLYTSADDLWIGDRSGLFRLPLDRPGPAERVEGIPRGVRVLHAGFDESLWIGTIDHGLFRLNPASDQPEPIPGIPPWITCLATAPGELWVGTYRQGLYRLDGPPGGPFQVRRVPLGDVPQDWQSPGRLGAILAIWIVLLGIASTLALRRALRRPGLDPKT